MSVQHSSSVDLNQKCASKIALFMDKVQLVHLTISKPSKPRQNVPNRNRRSLRRRNSLKKSQQNIFTKYKVNWDKFGPRNKPHESIWKGDQKIVIGKINRERRQNDSTKKIQTTKIDSNSAIAKSHFNLSNTIGIGNKGRNMKVAKTIPIPEIDEEDGEKTFISNFKRTGVYVKNRRRPFNESELSPIIPKVVIDRTPVIMQQSKSPIKINQINRSQSLEEKTITGDEKKERFSFPIRNVIERQSEGLRRLSNFLGKSTNQNSPKVEVDPEVAKNNERIAKLSARYKHTDFNNLDVEAISSKKIVYEEKINKVSDEGNKSFFKNFTKQRSKTFDSILTDCKNDPSKTTNNFCLKPSKNCEKVIIRITPPDEVTSTETKKSSKIPSSLSNDHDDNHIFDHSKNPLNPPVEQNVLEETPTNKQKNMPEQCDPKTLQTLAKKFRKKSVEQKEVNVKKNKIKLNAAKYLNDDFHKQREMMLNEKFQKIADRLSFREVGGAKNKELSGSQNDLDRSQNFFAKYFEKRRNSRLQQIDGGFFERFGAIFQEFSYASNKSKTSKHKSVEDENSETQNDSSENSSVEEDEIEKNLEILNELEQVDLEQDDKTGFINDSIISWNVDELYLEILHEIIYNVGYDSHLDITQDELFNYVQEAFNMSSDKHQTLLQLAEKKEAPEILLNIEVIAAKELAAKDANGLNDPFVTLYLQSMPTHRYNTSVKSATLNPMWEEHFSLPISENYNDDCLCVEVWDFDPAETVREKICKICDVRGVKGIRKLFKEIAITASTGQHENELIGKTQIPLRSVPTNGITMWYGLEKKAKMRRQGLIKIKLSFNAHKQTKVAAQEHRSLLKIFLLHELDQNKVGTYEWCGDFSPTGKAVLAQHTAQSSLSETDIALAKWIVYCSVHIDHPLSFNLFSSLLDTLIKPLKSDTICQDETKMFWDATRKLLMSCFSLIRKIQKMSNTNDKNILKHISEILHILAKLSQIEPPPNFDLFPVFNYPWLSPYKESNCDIKVALKDAITQNAQDWLDHVIDVNQSNGCVLEYLKKITQLVMNDLQRAIEYYDDMFQTILNFPYAKTLYVHYEQRLSEIMEPEVKEVCKSRKKLKFDEVSVCDLNMNADEPLAQGTVLFELYLITQRFVMLGNGLSTTSDDYFHIQKFYEWFHTGVAQWLEITMFKALQRIEKAVELDNFAPIAPDVKYSSSAVDTLTVFYQIKTFWQQLNWPDVEDGYTFIAKIIDDICRCCVFYSDKLIEMIEKNNWQCKNKEQFNVTPELCYAVNNIDYVREALPPFAKELGVDEIIEKLSAICSTLDEERCRQSLNNQIDNAVDTVKNKIIEVLEKVSEKMTPSISKLMVDIAEAHSNETGYANLNNECIISYLDENLNVLHEELSTENFKRIHEIVWESLTNTSKVLIYSNLEKRRRPSFFSNLHDQLLTIRDLFNKSDSTNEYTPEFVKVENLLRLHSLTTSSIIHQVHLERWREQQKLTVDQAKHGMLTVRCKFTDDNTLKIEIMNARNLRPMDSNGLCDSFVKINFLPDDVFGDAPVLKTQTNSKTLFPLYDETFTVPLSSKQRLVEDGLIMFNVKDKDLFGMSSQYMAEGYLHFSEISETTAELDELPQVHLILTKPTSADLEPLKVLRHRQADKVAKEFLKKYSQRMANG